MQRRQVHRLAAFLLLLPACVAGAAQPNPACASTADCFAVLEDPLSESDQVGAAKQFLLAAIGRSPPVGERLVAMLVRGAPRVRVRAVAILNSAGYARGSEATLRAAIEDGLPDLGRLYLRTIGSSGVIALRTALRDPSTDVEDVVDAVSEESPPFAVRIAVAALRCSKDCEFPDPRRVAKAAFAALAGQDNVGAAIEQFSSVITDPAVPLAHRVAAIDGYFQMASAATIVARRTTLLRWLATRSNAEQRWHIAVGLAHFGDNSGTGVIAAGLREDPLAGLAALLALGTDGRDAARAVLPLLGRAGPVGVAANETLAVIDPDLFCHTVEPLRDQIDPWAMRTYVQLIASMRDPACRLSLRRLPRFWHPGIAALIDSIASPTPPDPDSPGFLPALCPGRRPTDTSQWQFLGPLSADAASELHGDVEFEGVPAAVARAEPTGWWLSLVPDRKDRPAVLARFERGRLAAHRDEFALEADRLLRYQRTLFAVGKLQALAMPPGLPDSVYAPLWFRIDESRQGASAVPLLYFPFEIDDVFVPQAGGLVVNAGVDGYIDLTMMDRPRWIGCEMPQ
jgi:hypothetical protein